MGVGMLKSFTVPKSPFGQARLTPLPTDDLTVAEAWIGEGELNLLEAHGSGFATRSPIRSPI